MKKYIIAACIVSVIVIGCSSNETKKEEAPAVTETTPVAETPKAEETPAPPVDSATMMKNWTAYMTPGDMQKMMASWDGMWMGDVSMWHMPGAPPELSKITTTNKTVLGGRYQVSNHKGTMMGMPFEGMGTLAFDNAKKVFISTWIDNVGTGLMTLEGAWDAATKTMNLSGKTVDPSAGTAKEMAIRETFQVLDDKNQLMTMYGPGPDGKEFKMMEIKFTRK